MPAQRVEQEEIDVRLQKMSAWSQCGEAIQRTLSFSTFLGAVAFVSQVAALAEAADHHPDILIRYSKVTLTIMTHESQGLTIKDFELAESIDTAFQEAS